MYSLVKFVDDGIYYICPNSCISKRKFVGRSVKVLWTDGFRYKAYIVAVHESYAFLQRLRDDIENKRLYISLTETDSDQGECSNKSNDENAEHFSVELEIDKEFIDSNRSLTTSTECFSFQLSPKVLTFESTANITDSIESESSNSVKHYQSDHSSDATHIIPSIRHSDDDSAHIDFHLDSETELHASNYDSNGPPRSKVHISSYVLEACSAPTQISSTHLNLYENDADNSIGDPDFNPADYSSDCNHINTENISCVGLSPIHKELQHHSTLDHNSDQIIYDASCSESNEQNIHCIELPVTDSNEHLQKDQNNIDQPNKENMCSVKHLIKNSPMQTDSTQSAMATHAGSLKFSRSSITLPLQQPRMFNDAPIPVFDIGVAGNRGSRRYFCIYCKKLSSNLPQHLKFRHSDQIAVRQFLSFPPCSKERKKIIETIRRNGDFEHNTYQEYNSGQVLVARRPATFSSPSTIITTCPECKGQFYKSSLRRHYKRCAAQFELGQRSTLILSRAIHRQIHSNACQSLVNRIFPVLRDDECVRVIQYDVLVIAIANHLCRLYPDPHFDDMIRAKLRLLGRLLLQIRTLDSAVKDFASLITPLRYDLIISGINKVAGLDESGIAYRAPTVATMSNTLFKVATDIWRIECIKSKNVAGKTDAEDFMLLLKTDNATVINRIALENRVQHQRQKKIKLPDKSDIQQLVHYVRRIRRETYCSLKNYKLEDDFPYAVWHSLASATLISLLVFNRRRPGELERITMSDYHSRHRINNFTSLDEQDCEAAKAYSRFEIRGKLNRSVPVLVHWEMELSLDLILQHRGSAGIPDDNPYVFGLPMLDHRQRYLRACVIMRIYSAACGAKEPHLLRATILRKQIATECAILDLTENTIKDVAMFMGHADDIHNKIYRLPVQTRDIVRMSRVLEEIQGENDVSDDDGDNEVNIDETEECDDFESLFMTDALPSTSQNGSMLSLNTVENLSSTSLSNKNEETQSAIGEKSKKLKLLSDSSATCNIDDENQSPILVKSMKRKHSSGLRRHAGPKLPWTYEEKQVAEQLFNDCITEEKLPSLNRVMSTIQNTQLKSRSPQGVKLWIQNEIAKKRALSVCSEGKISTKISRPRWSAQLKATLFNVFKEYIEENRLPSNAAITVAMEQYPILKEKNMASIKTSILNERNRRKKAQLATRDQFILQHYKKTK